jgi:hypothetical protein
MMNEFCLPRRMVHPLDMINEINDWSNLLSIASPSSRENKNGRDRKK